MQKQRSFYHRTDQPIYFLNANYLANFLNKGHKILHRKFSGLTPGQHRRLAREVKKARFFGLLPNKHY